ncbi:MAG: hypothetical protein V4629_03615 [Pseudomonadota bacterium]
MKTIARKNITYPLRVNLRSAALILSILLTTGCQTTNPTLETTLPSESPQSVSQIEPELNLESLQDQQLKIEKLTMLVLQSIEKQIEALKLTQPAENNAWDQLQRLESVVGSEKTIPLKYKIIETYLSLAKENINPDSSTDNFEQAKSHISMARQLYHLLPETNTSIAERISQTDINLKNQLASMDSTRSSSQQQFTEEKVASKNFSDKALVTSPTKKLVYEKLLPYSDVIGRTDQARQLISYQANRIVEENLRVVVTASSMSDYRWVSAVIKSAVNAKKSGFQLQCEPLIETESVPSMKFFQ